MKKSSILFILLLCASTLLPFFVQTQPVVAQTPGDLVEPGDILTGSLDSDNPGDYYGVDISSPGLYNLSVESIGNSAVYASVSYYASGYITSFASSVLSNDSRLVTISPIYLTIAEHFQIRVSLENSDESAEYTVEFEKYETMAVVSPNEVKTYDFEANEESWFMFEAEGTSNAYNLTVLRNVTHVVGWSVYKESGLMHSDHSTSVNRSYALIMDPGLYYVNVENNMASDVKVWLEFVPMNLEVVGSGSTITEHLNSTIPGQSGYYYQLSLEEGMYYEINVDTEATANPAFFIYKGPASAGTYHLFDFGGLGESENVTDLVFFGKCSMYTSWDQNLTGHWVRGYSIMSSTFEGDLLDHSRLVLYLTGGGDGDVTLTIDRVGEVPNLTPGGDFTAHFNNTQQSLSQLIRINGTPGMTAYELALNHVPAEGFNLSTTYQTYVPYTMNQYYIYLERPFLSEEDRAYLDRTLGYEMWVGYDEYGPDTNETEYFYNYAGEDRWLVLTVPDAVVSGAYSGNPLYDGQVEILLKALPVTNIPIGQPTSIEPVGLKPHIARFELVAGHTYKISISATNASSIAYGTVLNSTGYIMPGYYTGGFMGYNPWATESDTSFLVLYVEHSGEYAMYLEMMGDSPVIVEIVDTTAAVSVDIPFVLIGIIGAAVVGVVIGLVIGKIRFGRSS